MYKPKGSTIVSVSIEKDLWEKVKDLAHRSGVDGAFAIRRALTYMVETGKIYWPNTEDKKATPVFDQSATEPVKASGSGQKGRATPAR